MEKHFELSDHEFEEQFRECILSPSDFTHKAHLRLAWIHIEKYGLDQAKENITTQLLAFVKHAGAIEKYHKTLTIVAVEGVNHFQKKSSSDNFSDFIVEFPQLMTDFKALMSSHYSFDIFGSAKAKSEYLEPDLIPFS